MTVQNRGTGCYPMWSMKNVLVITRSSKDVMKSVSAGRWLTKTGEEKCIGNQVRMAEEVETQIKMAYLSESTRSSNTD
jgi:hypothetical protein